MWVWFFFLDKLSGSAARLRSFSKQNTEQVTDILVKTLSRAMTDPVWLWVLDFDTIENKSYIEYQKQNAMMYHKPFYNKFNVWVL